MRIPIILFITLAVLTASLTFTRLLQYLGVQ
jgi:hypothetical protein